MIGLNTCNGYKGMLTLKSGYGVAKSKAEFHANKISAYVRTHVEKLINKQLPIAIIIH